MFAKIKPYVGTIVVTLIVLAIVKQLRSRVPVVSDIL